MVQLTLPGLSTPGYQPSYSATKTIDLNENEIQCLNMAITFLKSQLGQSTEHLFFQQLRDYHINYLNHWLQNNDLKKQLRIDGVNSVTWSMTSLEDAKWLALALEVGMADQLFNEIAKEHADYHYDMKTIYTSDEARYTLADLSWYDNYECKLTDCRKFSASKNGLLAKLRTILSD